MFVCVCNGITHRQIEEAIEHGATTLEDLTIALGVGAGCGTCAAFTRQLLGKALEARRTPTSTLSLAA
jgi:bacterioferritin-associated ferredoxin